LQDDEMTTRRQRFDETFLKVFVVLIALLPLGDCWQGVARGTEKPQPLRLGIIGLDTSHVVAFTQALNRPDAADHVPGARVVAAYPQGSRDIESSVRRVPGYTKTLRELDVEIVPSIAAVISRVDAIMLESNDGRVHLEQAAPVLAAGKPLFIDKPMAASLADVMAIFELARHHGTPVFSSSCLRYGESTQAVRRGTIGAVLGCDIYSPDVIEATHPDFFWYGIHGCEALFTAMGTGCESVSCTRGSAGDCVTGRWKNGRIGTFRGLRDGKRGYGGTAFGSEQIMTSGENPGYRPLMVEIIRFFQTGKPPVAPEETLEIFAFMEAAGESRDSGGGSVRLAEIFARAEGEKQRRLQPYLAPKK